MREKKRRWSGEEGNEDKQRNESRQWIRGRNGKEMRREGEHREYV